MARLSNFLRLHDPADAGPAIECRPASHDEIEQGLRLILATASGPASDDAVLDFCSLAVHRRIELDRMWVATRGGRTIWALLPVVSPGRTVLFLTPSRLFRQTPPEAIGLLADAVCDEYGRRGLVLGQVLLDPHDPNVAVTYRAAGFEDLAQLIYLHRSVLHAPPMPELPDDLELVRYSDEQYPLFAETIERSYERSLDCPALNGRRNVTDIIAGHKGAGIFEPSMWFVLAERGTRGLRGRGVLLLNGSIHPGAVELVYLGLVPESRGRGLGDLLMRVALATLGERDFTELTLAVDSMNKPALGLYFRHGMKRAGSRVALVRALDPRALETSQH